ncbi:hypothetical protein GUITHDRAFT_149097 [Guillardia theta CCMP2712]|uniref:Uncharacterized protein n=1 Tax=Guillardia theta (strain CCMP2712) TaxID=905079 RepID=L1I656_GUITC|nr:hypothetical protein GUITHDRAFT_149097 [Guillardia theta CCMP2712]EKX31748.1 hypothetical protein GUITHDRAFT_149097 [Guillardia theta CCMP2712]|eukprot:XP_005818728.1 hypothetical protein GUITHDRAFT_149097 [Guillardia theta CCMP2712]
MASAVLPMEGMLSGIKADDRVVIENVVAVMQGLSRDLCFHDYEVRTSKDGFVIIAKTSDSILSLSDLQLIRDANPVRVQNVGVVPLEGKRIALHVKVLSSTAPVTLTEVDIVRVKKRRHWGFF